MVFGAFFIILLACFSLFFVVQRPFHKSIKWILQGQVCLYPLSPYSDENETSLNTINAYSNIQVMRIKEVITEEKIFRYLDNSPN